MSDLSEINNLTNNVLDQLFGESPKSENLKNEQSDNLEIQNDQKPENILNEIVIFQNQNEEEKNENLNFEEHLKNPMEMMLSQFKKEPNENENENENEEPKENENENECSFVMSGIIFIWAGDSRKEMLCARFFLC